MTDRLLALDTETTGLDPNADRIIELGLVEIRHAPNRRHWHWLIHPEGRPIPKSATAVHGLTEAMLEDCPRFADIIDPLLEAIGEATLVIHNAQFDGAFLAAAFARAGREPPPNPVLDTLALARAEFPTARRSLDALARRFSIDLNRRAKRHGALIDAEILADIYLAWKGQEQLALEPITPATPTSMAPSARDSLHSLPVMLPPSRSGRLFRAKL